MSYFARRSAVSTLKTSHTTTSFVSSSLTIHGNIMHVRTNVQKSCSPEFLLMAKILSKAEWSWPFSIQQKITIDLYICAFCCLEYMGMPIRSLCEMLKTRNFKMQFCTLFCAEYTELYFVIFNKISIKNFWTLVL